MRRLRRVAAAQPTFSKAAYRKKLLEAEQQDRAAQREKEAEDRAELGLSPIKADGVS